MAPADQLLLITDGVVEAQDQHGAVFGFDRLRELLERHTSPGLLADTAQSFGQQDDITVLEISRSVENRTLPLKTAEDSTIAVHG